MVFTDQVNEFLFGIPFVGMLLSIALGPTLLPKIWHSHYFKIASGWGGICLISLFWRFDSSLVFGAVHHTLLDDYLPFIILIGTLFTITGSIHIHITGQATSLTNVVILAIGGLLASVIGTTGAAMLLIRPLIRLNSYRRKKTHIIVFFIFIVANIGGTLTPLGDPPLFLGYLKGVSFSWPIYHLFLPWLMILLPLMAIFYALDRYFFEQDPRSEFIEIRHGQPKIHIQGFLNLIPLIGVVLTIWLSGVASPLMGLSDLKVTSMIRDMVLIVLGGISWVMTPSSIHEKNGFSWAPFIEISKVFLVIFITILPVIGMLQSGLEGPFSKLLIHANPNGNPDNQFYFWAAGLLSAFLDNAPTYLVFFHMAGGEASMLTVVLKDTLVAISCGSVFMGALSYIGNAPNFMVRAIAETSGIKMPSFFGYMGWSFSLLLPLFFLLDFFFFK